MPETNVTLPFSGAGDLTADVHVDDLGVDGVDQYVKVEDGTPGSTNKLQVNSAGQALAEATIVSEPAAQRTTDSVSAAKAIDKLMHNLSEVTPKFAIIDAGTNGDNTIVTAVSGQKIRPVFWWLMAAAQVTCRWKSGTSSNKSGPFTPAANGGVAPPFCELGTGFETAASEALVLNLGGTVAVGGTLVYVEVT